MARDTTRRTLYDTLLELSRLAHARGEHEVAYYTLTSALHAARGLQDRAKLAEVQHEAEDQLAWIDEHAGGHRLSSRSAQRGGHLGVYAVLQREAATLANVAARTRATTTTSSSAYAQPQQRSSASPPNPKGTQQQLR
jgi:hypothetical protein